jgi:hypothetical protein
MGRHLRRFAGAWSTRSRQRSRSGGWHRSGAPYRRHQQSVRGRRDDVNVHSGQENQKKVIDFYGTSVLPQLNIRT